MQKLSAIVLLACCLTACSSDPTYAPVTDITTIEHIPKNGTYRVSAGETLYSIAWRYGLDYRYLANLNHIAPPFHVVAGQRIYLANKFIRQIQSMPTLPQVSPTRAPHSMNSSGNLTPYVIEHDANQSVSAWRWPAHGPVLGVFSAQNKGVNIGGKKGNPIYATAAGQVVYSGNGLRGYGNLIIIKHNSTYLSAYAHTSLLLVKEGQRVNAGQEIAEMGSTSAERNMLHFEIRRNGRPVNPLNYLSTHD